jgi:arginine utilization protein RocB
MTGKMNRNHSRRFKKLLKELVGVPSISATKGEVDWM